MEKQKCASFRMKFIIAILLFNVLALRTEAEKPCPDACECSRSKKSVELKCKVDSKMNISELSNFDTSSITSLDLSGNQINSINNEIFINMTNLKKLDLSNNTLKIVDEETFNEYLENLEFLKLTQNNIEKIYQGSFEKLKSLKQIDLTSNPLQCDCDLMWIQNISIKLKPVPKCGAPDIFKNTSVKKLRIGQDLHCTKALDPILELKPSLNQLIFEGDSLTLRCRSYNLRMKDDKKLADDKIYWGYSETIPEENLLQDIFYHNPQVKFPSVLIDSRSSDSGILDTILRIPYVSRNHSGNYDCRLVSQQANLSRSVSVLVISEKTKYCHATETSSNKGDYSWPKTIVQKTVVLPCVSEVSQNAFASKKCNELGFWEKADVSKCPYVREETRILEQFANMNFSIARSSIIESAKRLKDYIEDNFQDFQDPMDVIYISKTIQSYLEFIKEEQGIAPLIIDIVSLVMDFPKKLLEKAQVQDNACKRLIESAEIATSTTLSPDSQKNNMAIEMFKLTSESFIEIQCSWYFNVEHSSRTFECNSAGKTRSLHDKNIEASISFPAAHVITPNEQRLLVSVYKNDNFFSQNKTFNNYRVTSSIIGIKLFASDGTKLNVKNLSDPILIALKSTPFHHDLSFPKPVFLDPDSESSGWTLDGCKSSHFVRGLLVFSCNRIGYYSLLQHTQFLNDFPEDENAGARFKLSPLGFYIGCCCLFICLWIIIVTYTVFFDQIQSPRRTKHAFINFCVSLSMLTFLFCIGIFQTESHYVCITFGLAIHYTSLCVLFWICVSVSQMYKKISRNDRISMESDLPREEYQRVKKPIMGMYYCGYGIAILICGINSAINLRDYHSYNYCFGIHAFSAFYVPGAVLLFFLIIMFICIRFHLRTRSSATTYLSEGITENGDIDLLEINNDPEAFARSVRSVTTNSNVEDCAHSPREQLFAFILLTFLYILNWTLAFAAITQPFQGRLIYEVEICTIAFAFSASFLGAYILFFYGVARPDVRNIWINLQCYIVPTPIQDLNSNKPIENNVVTGSVFYHRPTTMSRSSSVMSRPKSVEIQYMKSASEINSTMDVNMRNGSSFLLLHRQQNSVINSGASSTAEVFYNPNQINVARRFFKKQKRLQKLNNIDVRSGTSPTSSNQLSEMFGTGGSGNKINNTNIHVNNDCKIKYSNPLSDSCNESELLTDLRFSTLKSKINNTDALQFANIYTNVPETQQPLHEIHDKFNQEVFNNLNSPVLKKNASPPLYVNTPNIMDESDKVEEIYATKDEISMEEPKSPVKTELDETFIEINSSVDSTFNTVGLPPVEYKTVEEDLQLRPEEEYISPVLEISNRSFNEIADVEDESFGNQLFDVKSKSRSMDNLDTNNSSHETHIRSISYNNLTAADHDLLLPVTKNMTSSLMMNRESQSPILISPSLCDIDDYIDDAESNYTVSNDSQDDLLNRNSKSDCTPIFLNPDNTPNFSIFNESAPSPTNFSEINYQNSELSIRSQDLYAPQEQELPLMAEALNFDISDEEDDTEDTFNDSRDFLIPHSNNEEFIPDPDNTNESENLSKGSQLSIDEIYEQIKSKPTTRPPILPKPNVKFPKNRHIFRNGET